MDQQGSQRVLFVDDETALVTLIVRGLGRFGYRITGCSDPLQALEAFRAAPTSFDAILTDLSMPTMSGFALARQIHEIRPDIPIVVMSGFVSAEAEAESKQCAIREIIRKPISLGQLGEALARVFSEIERVARP
jgi:CheY-like chemotaxis protein